MISSWLSECLMEALSWPSSDMGSIRESMTCLELGSGSIVLLAPSW